MPQQKRYREATFDGADGVVLVRTWPTPPRLRRKVLRLLNSSAQPPRSAEARLLLLSLANWTAAFYDRAVSVPALRQRDHLVVDNAVRAKDFLHVD